MVARREYNLSSLSMFLYTNLNWISTSLLITIIYVFMAYVMKGTKMQTLGTFIVHAMEN